MCTRHTLSRRLSLRDTRSYTLVSILHTSPRGSHALAALRPAALPSQWLNAEHSRVDLHGVVAAQQLEVRLVGRLARACARPDA